MAAQVGPPTEAAQETQEAPLPEIPTEIVDVGARHYRTILTRLVLALFRGAGAVVRSDVQALRVSPDIKWLLAALNEPTSGAKEMLVDRVHDSRGPVKRMDPAELWVLPASHAEGKLAIDQHDLERSGRAKMEIFLVNHVCKSTATRPHIPPYLVLQNDVDAAVKEEIDEMNLKSAALIGKAYTEKSIEAELLAARETYGDFCTAARKLDSHDESAFVEELKRQRAQEEDAPWFQRLDGHLIDGAPVPTIESIIDEFGERDDGSRWFDSLLGVGFGDFDREQMWRIDQLEAPFDAAGSKKSGVVALEKARRAYPLFSRLSWYSARVKRLREYERAFESQPSTHSMLRAQLGPVSTSFRGGPHGKWSLRELVKTRIKAETASVRISTKTMETGTKHDLFYFAGAAAAYRP